MLSWGSSLCAAALQHAWCLRVAVHRIQNLLYAVSTVNVDASGGINTGPAALPLPNICELHAREESQPNSVITQVIAVSMSSLYFGVEEYLHATEDLPAASVDMMARLGKGMQVQSRIKC